MHHTSSSALFLPEQVNELDQWRPSFIWKTAVEMKVVAMELLHVRTGRARPPETKYFGISNEILSDQFWDIQIRFPKLSAKVFFWVTARYQASWGTRVMSDKYTVCERSSELNLGVQPAGFTVVKSYRPTDDYKDYLRVCVAFLWLSFDMSSDGRAAGSGGQLTPKVTGGGQTISLIPNDVWAIWRWCFSPALRSTFSNLKRTIMHDFDQTFSKHFWWCYPRTPWWKRATPSRPFLFPPTFFDPSILSTLCRHWYGMHWHNATFVQYCISLLIIRREAMRNFAANTDLPYRAKKRTVFTHSAITPPKVSK